MAEKITGGNRKILTPLCNELPVVSIIIATYNAAAHLQECLDSVKSQPFQNIELLIFDGSSSDNTVKILQENNNIISYWHSEADKGIYHALNTAVSYAGGDWIYFLGSDDQLLPGFSEMAEKLVDKNTLYYGHCLRNNEKTNEGTTPFRITKFNVCHHAIFYPAIVFKKFSYNTRYVIYADHAINIQVWADKSIGKEYYPIAIARYSPYGFSTRTKDEVFRAEKAKWIAKHLGWITALRYLVKQWKIRRKEDKEYF
jgi:glycosyltransferase involved in cell wall biosynthesis